MDPTTCTINGHAAILGLGIRIGFYLQWLGAILAPWLAPSQMLPIRHMNTLFLLATFVSLIVLRDSLSIPETYIASIFLFGSALYVLPEAYLRFTARHSPHCAFLPGQTTVPPRGKTFGVVWSVLVFGELGYMLVFWFSHVSGFSDETCQRYAFLLAQVELGGLGLFLFTMMLDLAVMVAVVFLLVKDLRAMPPRELEMEISRSFQWLRLFSSLTEFFVVFMVATAIEVSIMWNNIRGVNSIDTTAQLIPTLVGVGGIVRIFYMFLYGPDRDPLENRFAVDFRQRIRNRICHPILYSRLPENYVQDEDAERVTRQGDLGLVSTEISASTNGA